MTSGFVLYKVDPMKLAIQYVFLAAVAFGCASEQTVQQEIETYTSPNGEVSFQYPSNWVMIGDGNNGTIIFDNPPIEQRTPDTRYTVEITLPEDVSQLSMQGFGSTPSEILHEQIRLSYAFEELMKYSAENPGQAMTAEREAYVEQIVGVRTNFVDIVKTPIGEWTAARALYNSFSGFSLNIVIDVGNDQIMMVSGDADTQPILLDNEQTIIALAESIRYIPLELQESGNPDLPRVFSGHVGALGLGELTFFYPEDWYVIPLGPFIQNSLDQLDQRHLEPGQMQIAFIAPELIRLLYTKGEATPDCEATISGVTAESILQDIFADASGQMELLAIDTVTLGDIETAQFGDHAVAYVAITEAEFTRDVRIVIIDQGQGDFIGLMVFTANGEMAQYWERVANMVATFEYTPTPCPEDE